MIISVASGKGGTGKTLVATSLALSLDEEVQFLDCDVEAPDSHLFLRPTLYEREPVVVPVPRVDRELCDLCGECARVCAYNAIAVVGKRVVVFPELCHGCGACTHFCPAGAISEEAREIGYVERGQTRRIAFVQGRLAIGEALSSVVIREVRRRAQDDQTVVVDAPPGTSCPVVESIKGSDFALLVTEPTPFGLHDLSLAVEMVRELGIPCGVVLNRAGTDDDRISDYCREQRVPVLMKIPLDRRIAEQYARGVTLVEGFPQWRSAFQRLFHRIREIVSAGGSGTATSQADECAAVQVS